MNHSRAPPHSSAKARIAPRPAANPLAPPPQAATTSDQLNDKEIQQGKSASRQRTQDLLVVPSSALILQKARSLPETMHFLDQILLLAGDPNLSRILRSGIPASFCTDEDLSFIKKAQQCSERELKEIFSLAKKRPGALPIAHTRDIRPTTGPPFFPSHAPSRAPLLQPPHHGITRTGKWHCARTTPSPHRRLGALIARSPRHHARPCILERVREPIPHRCPHHRRTHLRGQLRLCQAHHGGSPRASQ